MGPSLPTAPPNQLEQRSAPPNQVEQRSAPPNQVGQRSLPLPARWGRGLCPSQPGGAEVCPSQPGGAEVCPSQPGGAEDPTLKHVCVPCKHGINSPVLASNDRNGLFSIITPSNRSSGDHLQVSLAYCSSLCLCLCTQM